MWISKFCLGILLLSSLWVSSARADLIVNLYEAGPNVIGVLSGTFDATPLPAPSPLVLQSPYVLPNQGFFGIGAPANAGFYQGVLSGFGSFGPSLNQTFTSTGSGNYVAAGGGNLVLPTGFSAGSLSGTATWSGQSFATLGLTPGTYVATTNVGPLQTVTLNVTAVPEPGTFGLLTMGAFAGAGTLLRRRRSFSLGTLVDGETSMTSG